MESHRIIMTTGLDGSHDDEKDFFEKNLMRYRNNKQSINQNSHSKCCLKRRPFSFETEKFARKYDAPDDFNPYNILCKVIARRQDVWDWAVPFLPLFEKRPVLFAKASAKNRQIGFVNGMNRCSLDKRPTKQ